MSSDTRKAAAIADAEEREGYPDPGDGGLRPPISETAIQKFKRLRHCDHPHYPYIRDYLQTDARSLVEEIEELEKNLAAEQLFAANQIKVGLKLTEENTRLRAKFAQVLDTVELFLLMEDYSKEAAEIMRAEILEAKL